MVLKLAINKLINNILATSKYIVITIGVIHRPEKKEKKLIQGVPYGLLIDSVSYPKTKILKRLLIHYYFTIVHYCTLFVKACMTHANLPIFYSSKTIHK